MSNMEVRFVGATLIYQLFALETETLNYKLLFVSEEKCLIEEKARELNTLIYSGFMVKSIRKSFYKLAQNG